MYLHRRFAPATRLARALRTPAIMYWNGAERRNSAQARPMSSAAMMPDASDSTKACRRSCSGVAPFVACDRVHER